MEKVLILYTDKVIIVRMENKSFTHSIKRHNPIINICPLTLFLFPFFVMTAKTNHDPLFGKKKAVRKFLSMAVLERGSTKKMTFYVFMVTALNKGIDL